MNLDEQRSILAICLHAAFADGAKDDGEREAIRRIAESLSDGGAPIDMARLYQDVLLKRLPVSQASRALSEIGQRQFAYEMAVCVCDTDGRTTPAERRFLDELRQALDLAPADAGAIEGQIEPVVAAAEEAPVAVTKRPAPLDASLDQTILNYALLNGALELLPQSWASMAIIPLQVRMVYGIGQTYGVELDQGHIKEFIAAAGVGLTSQYLGSSVASCSVACSARRPARPSARWAGRPPGWPSRSPRPMPWARWPSATTQTDGR